MKRRTSIILRNLLEKNKRIEQSGGIGRKSAKLPASRNDIVAKTKRKSEELLSQIS